jgi:hypothetical protein
MTAAATGEPDWARLRHGERKPGPFIKLSMGEAICKCCGKRKPRKGGANISGKFYCAQCK